MADIQPPKSTQITDHVDDADITAVSKFTQPESTTAVSPTVSPAASPAASPTVSPAASPAASPAIPSVSTGAAATPPDNLPAREQFRKDKLGPVEDKNGVTRDRTATEIAKVVTSSPDDLDKLALTGRYADLPNLDQKLKDTKTAYEAEVQRVGHKQAVVSLFSVLGQIAVGMYGIQHGVNTSGVKFDAYDWAADYKKAMDNYKLSSELRMQQYTSVMSDRDKLMSRNSTEANREQMRKDSEERIGLERQSLGIRGQEVEENRKYREGEQGRKIGYEQEQLNLKRHSAIDRDEALHQKALDSETLSKAVDSKSRLSLIGDEADRLKAQGASVLDPDAWAKQQYGKNITGDLFESDSSKVNAYRSYVKDQAFKLYQAKRNQVDNPQPLVRAPASSPVNKEEPHPDQVSNGWLYSWDGTKYVGVRKVSP